MTDVEVVKNLKARYAELIPAAVRKAVLECVADLADEVAPPWRAIGGDGGEQDAILEAWDAAIDEFTAHLKKTLLLDPQPMRSPYGDGSGRFEIENRLESDHFDPRPHYSQNEEDYS